MTLLPETTDRRFVRFYPEGLIFLCVARELGYYTSHDTSPENVMAITVHDFPSADVPALEELAHKETVTWMLAELKRTGKCPV